MITFYQICYSFYICRTASWLLDPFESKKSHLYRWGVWKIFLCRWAQWNQERCCCIRLHQLVSNTDIRCKIYELSSHMTTAMITSCSNCEKNVDIIGNTLAHSCWMFKFWSYLFGSIIGCVKTIRIQQLRTNYFGVATLLDMYSGVTPTTSRFF